MKIVENSLEYVVPSQQLSSARAERAREAVDSALMFILYGLNARPLGGSIYCLFGLQIALGIFSPRFFISSPQGGPKYQDKSF